MKLLQIGTVMTDHQGTYIQLQESYKEGLKALEGFSHVTILWWGHLYDMMDYRSHTLIEKPYKTGPDEVGVFATRSPIRPNPILTTVMMVSELDPEEGRLYTPYIDAEPGTPVLDVKPYFPCSDLSKSAETPKWCSQLPDSIEASARYDWASFFNFES